VCVCVWGGLISPQTDGGTPNTQMEGGNQTLTVVIQEELIEAQAAGLLPNEAVHVLRAVVVNGDGVLQRLDAGLQAEGHLGVPGRVPAGGDR